MTPTIPGLHHVTAITADAQANVDFYCGALGLRLVKRTVNFDDPTGYHLYYGDRLGRPGTILTFFAWPGAGRGRVGPPQAVSTALEVPSGTLTYWEERLERLGVPTRRLATRFGEAMIGFEDPDGMALELVASGEPGGSGSEILGIRGVTLAEEGHEATAQLLTGPMGFREEARDGNRCRYRADGGGFASVVDLLCVPDARQGSPGAGIVHHIAFRTDDDASQRAWRGAIASAGLNVSPVMDRNYFRSIYFREPGGVLFEIATDPPGFSADEPEASLGRRLMLPAQFEPRRAELERLLPTLRVPRPD